MSNTEESMTIMKILCNPNRFAILSLLSDITNDICVNEIAEKVGISQSLASHQLSYLEARGIVKSMRMGKTICYELDTSTLVKKSVKVINLLK